LENITFLLAAFIIVWLVLFGYVWFIASRQVRLSREIAVLREELAQKKTE